MSFKELRVQEAAKLLHSEVAQLLRSLPPKSVTRDQLHRAAQSVVCNVAESRGRHTYKERIHFFSIARGSSDEVRACLQICIRLGYLTEKTAYRAIGLTYAVGKMITALTNTIAIEKR
jgi:four helix bundle protein